MKIAIDGPSGSGKSTVAKALAKELNCIYVDTGALYRTVGLAAQRAGVNPSDAQAMEQLLGQIPVPSLRYESGTQHVLLGDEDVSARIRTPEISSYASQVSAIPAVRAFLLDLQRDMGRRNDVIMDGRDIGTVVFPDAEVKIFLHASAQERARRRYLELVEKGEPVTLEAVEQDMAQRDQRDSQRAAAPLKRAQDAVDLDTTGMSLEESVAAALAIVKENCYGV